MRQFQIALFPLCLTCGLLAQEKPTVTQPTILQMKVRPGTKLHKNDTTTNLPSLSGFEAFTNLVVQPGQYAVLTSTLDWTGAVQASVAIECPASTSLQNVQIAVEWAMPAYAGFWTATSVIAGNTLLLPNMGGAVVPAFGNQLQILLINSGTTTVTCDQLTVYALLQ